MPMATCVGRWCRVVLRAGKYEADVILLQVSQRFTALLAVTGCGNWRIWYMYV